MKAVGAALTGAFFCLALVVSAAAQLASQAPQIRGVWHPVVGSGAVYEMQEASGKTHEIQFAVLDSEPVGSDTGYWLEMGSRGGGGTSFVFKQLLVLQGGHTRVKRVIVQPDDEAPIELPVTAQPDDAAQPADLGQTAKLVGTEDVTTLAGTFSCKHYRMKDGSGEMWISEKVPPWSLVKSSGREFSMTLVRVVTDAKTQIKGTPLPLRPGN
jgi:hypothetical protein